MEFKIFGCKVNKYYTDKWLNSEQLANKTGIFIASCVVTDKAKRKWVKFVKDTIKTGKISGDKKVYISGCGAFKSGKAQDDFFDIYPDLLEYKNYIIILGEDPEEEKIDKTHKNLKKTENREVSKNKNLERFKKLTSGGIYTKKFILIQGGCDSFCTFCLTVKKRGRHFFRSADDIIEEILEFEINGGKEIVLTGVNLASWGLDTTNDITKSRFSELLELIIKKTDIPRIRISSIGPEFIEDKCLKVFENKRIYPHFHYSVQSLNSTVLKNMKRHYDAEYIKNILIKTKNIKREDSVSVSLGADMIIGFPGETEKDFIETYEAIKNIGIEKVHAFPFSAHDMGESVPAGSFKNQVPDKIKKERMLKLTKLTDHIREKFINSQKGKTLEVLIEVEKDGKFKGWTQNYIEATEKNFKIASGIIKKNEIIKGELF